MFNIRTYNKISDKGLSRFSPSDYKVAEDIEHPHAILLRSQKLHDELLPSSVLAIGRAGAGTNNIPVEQYTHKGIVVFNTPGANANAVKELVVTSLLLSARGIIQGREFVNSLTHITDADEMAKLLEQEKNRFGGNELLGRTLGIIGLGAIGSLVADVALALGMDVVGFDPGLSIDGAWRLSSRVRRMENMESLLSEVDFLTIHVPAIPATKHLINEKTLKLMKQDATILNFARAAIVDQQAVVKALDAGKLNQYICDFPEPCLIGHDKVIAVPHIGASTVEAEENCAVMAVEQLCDYLENGNIKNSVNYPHTSMPRGSAACRITFTNKNIAGVLGNLLSIFAENNINVVDMVNKSRDEVAYNILDLESPPSEVVVRLIKDVEHVFNLRLIYPRQV
ncbi:MAG: 3-phosphoglycerate dehydrogenase [Gammaproteobacteria bacterium]|nr:MAG: 3-phosphoglycerate dehydrogenase [Gammaproteobacteria bacterium]